MWFKWISEHARLLSTDENLDDLNQYKRNRRFDAVQDSDGS
jgi:hypothetical protein